MELDGHPPTLEDFCKSAIELIADARKKDTEWDAVIEYLDLAIEDIDKAIALAQEGKERDES